MKCPSCGSGRVFPSRMRNVLEKAWQALTDKQPYRCHECGWRRWREVELHQQHPDVHPDDLRTGRRGTPVSTKDLDQIDPVSPQS